MKGTIGSCLQDMVKEKFGPNQWISILSKSGLSEDRIIYSHQDIDDDLFAALLSNTCEVLNVNLENVIDDFEKYWMMEYAPKVDLAHFLQQPTAKDYLLNLHKVCLKVD